MNGSDREEIIQHSLQTLPGGFTNTHCAEGVCVQVCVCVSPCSPERRQQVVWLFCFGLGDSERNTAQVSHAHLHVLQHPHLVT